MWRRGLDTTRRYPRLTVAHVPTQPNILIFDDTWANSGFDWLSFRDHPTRAYRPEEGTLVRGRVYVDERYLRYRELIAEAGAKSGR